MSYKDIEAELLNTTTMFSVEYKVFGENVAATHEDPAEYQEMEISSIARHGSVLNIVSIFTEEEIEEVKALVQEQIDECVANLGVDY